MGTRIINGVCIYYSTNNGLHAAWRRSPKHANRIPTDVLRTRWSLGRSQPGNECAGRGTPEGRFDAAWHDPSFMVHVRGRLAVRQKAEQLHVHAGGKVVVTGADGKIQGTVTEKA